MSSLFVWIVCTPDSVYTHTHAQTHTHSYTHYYSGTEVAVGVAILEKVWIKPPRAVQHT